MKKNGRIRVDWRKNSPVSAEFEDLRMGFEGGELWVLRLHTDTDFPLGAEKTIGGRAEHEPICESVIAIGPQLANKHLGSGRFDPEPIYDSVGCNSDPHFE